MSYKGKNFCFGRNGISEFVGLVSALFLNFRYLGSPFGAGRDSVVGMATRLRDGRRGVRTPVGARDFLFSKPLPGGTAVAQRLRCCATNQKVAGSIPDCAIGIFH